MRVWIAASLLCAGTAGAGPLGRVVEGLHEAAENDDPPEQRPPRHDSSDDRGPSCDPDTSAGSSSGSPGPLPPMRVDGALAVAAMTGSGPAVTGRFALRLGAVAVGGGVSSFFEQDGSETTRLDLWRVGGGLRIFDFAETELWVEGAFAGVHTQPELSLLGGYVGGRIEHHATPKLTLAATLGTVALQHDVDALEISASVRMYVFTVGYRVLDFNVGPPLHGPEVGIAFNL